MRWIYIILMALAATLMQTTAAQVLWLPTGVGWVGPIVPAAAGVFVGLYARSAVDAALAGWLLGFCLELPLGGATIGLLSLLFAAGCAGLLAVREAFFRDRLLTQAVLGLLFCMAVYEAWAIFDAFIPGGSGHLGRASLQVLAASAYTAVLTPLVCALLKPLQRAMWTMPSMARRR